MRKIAVNGTKGRLGSTLVRLYPGCYPLFAEITNKQAVKEELDRVKPDVVIHCAAFTDVDACENQQTKTLNINMTGVNNVRSSFEGRMVLISTDYVFDGKKGKYKEDAKLNPISIYGMSKFGGEGVLDIWDSPEDVIIRTTLLYGAQSKPDFVSKLLEQFASTEGVIPVTNRLYGNPTNVEHLAMGIMDLLSLPKAPRVVNIAGTDYINRYEFALMIADVFGLDKERIVLNHAPRKEGAPRPEKAGLDLSLAKKLKIRLFPIHEGLLLARQLWN